MKYAKLRTAASIWGVHYRTILSWANKGQITYITLPSRARQYELPTETNNNQKIIGYIRVSSHSQKDNLFNPTYILHCDRFFICNQGFSHNKPLRAYY
jgi:predicted site-specific integrase-resolvase